MDPACGLSKKDPGLWNQLPEETFSHLLLGAQEQWLGVEQDQLHSGSTGTSSGNCLETETCMVWACYMPEQHLQNHPSGHLWGWATLWLAKDMLDGQHQRVDVPAHAKAPHNGLLQKRLEQDLYWIVHHAPDPFPPPSTSTTTQSIKGLNWTELNNPQCLLLPGYNHVV